MTPSPADSCAWYLHVISNATTPFNPICLFPRTDFRSSSSGSSIRAPSPHHHAPAHFGLIPVSARFGKVPQRVEQRLERFEGVMTTTANGTTTRRRGIIFISRRRRNVGNDATRSQKGNNGCRVDGAISKGRSAGQGRVHGHRPPSSFPRITTARTVTAGIIRSDDALAHRVPTGGLTTKLLLLLPTASACTTATCIRCRGTPVHVGGKWCSPSSTSTAAGTDATNARERSALGIERIASRRRGRGGRG
mmetsp:Transcript_32077/g.70528  ORF Transcript_32077/g.70528 Transcript_32077/m.70528 type:complete len:249 (+) Transcript_32077:910-1656(+)